MGCYFAPPPPSFFSSLLLPRFIAFPIPILVFSSFHCSKISTSPVGYPTDPLAPSSSPTPPINNPSLSFIIVLTSLCSTLFTCISTPLLYHPRDRPLISSYTSRLMCIYSHYFISTLIHPLLPTGAFSFPLPASHSSLRPHCSSKVTPPLVEYPQQHLPGLARSRLLVQTPAIHSIQLEPLDFFLLEARPTLVFLGSSHTTCPLFTFKPFLFRIALLFVLNFDLILIFLAWDDSHFLEILSLRPPP